MIENSPTIVFHCIVKVVDSIECEMTKSCVWFIVCKAWFGLREK